MDKRFYVFLILLLASIAMAAPSLRGDILAFDDGNLLLGPDGAVERGPLSFFTRLYYYAYLPFYGLSYWLDGFLGGTDQVVFHLNVFHVGNVFWHAAACFALYLLLASLFQHSLGAFLGALLFATRPLHVESVAWISGRKEVLSSFLLLLAWIVHLKGRTIPAVDLLTPEDAGSRRQNPHISRIFAADRFAAIQTDKIRYPGYRQPTRWCS